jgi:hypothetical protein
LEKVGEREKKMNRERRGVLENSEEHEMGALACLGMVVAALRAYPIGVYSAAVLD